MDRKFVYFVSDVHLGLNVNDPVARERRFVDFLRSIPAQQTEALYMLGDIWDFWYEYKYVVPKGYVKVFAALIDLIESGVKVFFFKGNHDIWCYSYFESLGIKILEQPYFVEYGGKTFCLGHGDGLGPGDCGYKLMQKVFRNRLAQILFSTLHPWFAFSFGNGWSVSRRSRNWRSYEFKGEEESIYKYALKTSASRHIDYFIFGHYHIGVDMLLPGGSRLMIMKDWVGGESDYLYFSGSSVLGGHSQNRE